MTTDDHGRTRDDPGLLTLTEAAARSGHTRSALRQRVRRGSLHSVKGNDGIVRLRLSDVDELSSPDAAADDQERPEDEIVVAAMDALQRTVDDLRTDRDRAWTTLDATRDELATERLKAGLAEGRMEASEARAAAAEARLAAVEATLAEARTPLLLRAIAAIRGRR